MVFNILSNDVCNQNINKTFTISPVSRETPLDRILRWAKDLGMDQTELAKELGVSSQVITNWKKRKRIPPEHHARAAQVIHHSVDEILGRVPERSGIRENEPLYLNLNGIPVVGTAQLGRDGFWTETEHAPGSGDGILALPSNDKNAYALRVVGDSMHPRIRSGEFVVVEPNHTIMAGDEVVVVTKDGRCMVKELAYRRDGMVALNSVNDGHPRLTLREEEIEKIHYIAAIAKSAMYRSE